MLRPQPYLLVTDAVEKAARLFPHRVALQDKSSQLNYQQLIESVNHAAGFLMDTGIKKNDVVALIAENNNHFVILMLAIFKIGGVLLSIDSSIPPQRKKIMLREAHAKWIISSEQNLIDETLQTEYTTLIWNTKITSQNHAWPKVNLKDSAYIFFTSGSTGKPKGILASHHGLSHFLTWQSSNFDINENDRCAQLTRLSFDVVLRSTLLALMKGAALIFPANNDVANPKTLHWLIQENITYSHVIPNLVKNWLYDLPRTINFPSLKYLFFAGEKLQGQLVNQFRKRVKSQAELINLYGPSETVLAKCYYTVPTVLAYPDVQPIGKPLPDTTVVIVNKKGGICAVNEEGEIAIQTSFPILGYVNLPDKILKPLANDKFYFTGDLGVRDENGLLLIKGRNDEQVKINGIRIEFGEVEFALEEYPDIKEAAVYLENNSIIACIIPRQDKTIDKQILVDFLNEHLSDEMLPKQFKIMKSFPHTQSGKLDRKKLAHTTFISLASNVKTRHKETSLSKKLGNIFKKVLAVKSIKPDDSFFDLGVNSLTAARLSYQLHTKMNCDIEVIDLYQHNTLYLLENFIHDHHLIKIKKKNTTSAQLGTYIPLSLQQQQYAFFQNCYPSSPAYNISYCFEFSSLPDRLILKQAFMSLMKKYPLLTIAVHYNNGQFQQKITPIDELSIPFFQLKRTQSPNAFIKKLLKQPFELGKSPPFRLAIIKKQKRYFLLWVIHHIITDGISSHLLLNELERYFQLYSGNKNIPRSARDKTYFQYCSNNINPNQISTGLNFWKNELDDFQFLELPYDFPDYQSNTSVSNNGKTKYYSLSLETKNFIEKFAKQNSITEFSVLFCAFGILLSRYAAQNDIIIGVPFHNRIHQYENTSGCFVNTLPVRFSYSSDKSFIALCQELNLKIAEIMQYQHISLPEIIKQLNLSGNLYKNPLFEVFFSYEVNAKQELILNKNKGKRLDLSNDAAKFELSFMIQSNQNKNLDIEIEYNRLLFNKTTIDEFFNQYQNTLTNLLQNSASQPVSRTFINPPSIAFNDSQHSNNTILALIENIATSFPSRIAIVDNGQSLLYEDLWIQVQNLAHELKKKNIGHNQIVATLIPRGEKLVIAMLATWYVGGIYLPLDTDLPLERLNVIMADAKPACIILNDINHAVLADYKNKIEILPFQLTDSSQVSNPLPSTHISLDDAAYLLYTSGTTGKPKGVLQTHKTLTNLFYEQCRELDNLDSLRVTQMASSLFDVSLQEMTFCLGNGGRLYIVPKNYKLQPDQLWAFLLDQHINVVFLPPALLQLLAEFHPSALKHHLRYFITAGEALTITPTIKNLMLKLKNCCLINQYGPTETHVASAYCLPNDIKSWPTLPPIGKPINNLYFAVLDQHLNYLTTGMKGELYIAGDGLALGYFNDDELTREKFIFLKVNNELQRFYKTGDIAVQKFDGEFYFYGRSDKQLNINGYRVEPAEIEYQLFSHPQITNCLVLPRKNKNQIVISAFYKTKDNISIPEQELNHLLAKSLPAYMHPKHYFHLENFPTNANGKVDISQLPLPLPSSTQVHSHALTSAQQAILDLCTKSLHIPIHSIDDNLLQSGFDSLSMATLVAMLNKHYHSKISIKDAFISPNIKALSEHINFNQPVSALNKKSYPGKKLSSFAMSIQQQRIYKDIKRGQNPIANNLSLAFQIEGKLNVESMQKAISSILHQFDVFHFYIKNNDKDNVIHINKKPMQKLEFIDYSKKKLSSKKWLSLLEDKKHEPLHPFHHGFYRIYFIKTKPHHYLLLLVIHHLCFDGTSMQVFLHELEKRYVYFCENKKTIYPYHHDMDYQDFCLDQSKHIGHILADGIDYFKNILTKEKDMLYLPANGKQISLDKNKKFHLYFNLDNDLVTQLQNTAHTQQMTLFTLFLHAYFLLIKKHIQRSKIIVGTTVNGRTDLAFEHCLGLFSQRTLLTTTSPRPDLTSLKETQNQTYQYLDHQTLSLYDYPDHEKLIKRKNIATPQFNLVFQNYAKSPFHLPQLKVEEIDLSNRWYSLDITDITFVINESNHGITIEIVYQEQVFSLEFIEILKQDYLNLISQIITYK